MESANPVSYFIEQIIKSLMTVLFGTSSIGSGSDPQFPPDPSEYAGGYAESAEAALPVEALLFVEVDGPANSKATHGDIVAITKRFQAIGIVATVAEEQDNHAVLHLAGPGIRPATITRLLDRGVPEIVSIEKSAEWLDAIPADQLSNMSLTARRDDFDVAPSLDAGHLSALQDVGKMLSSKKLKTFIGEPNSVYHPQNYSLYMTRRIRSITGKDLVAASVALEMAEYPMLNLDFKPKKIAKLVAACGVGPESCMALTVDGKLYRWLNATSFNAVDGQDSLRLSLPGWRNTMEESWQEVTLMAGIFTHGALHSRWRLVHLAPLPLQSAAN